jgi:4-amino-4-deoxy-L-arabinose transferase-like glycosyltransferase
LALADRFALLLAFFPFVGTLLGIDVFYWIDEGLYLEGGRSVLHGEAPYRDFQWHYLPGAPYLMAVLLGVSGGKFWFARLAFAAALLAASILVLLLTRYLTGTIKGWVALSILPVCLPWRAELRHLTLEPLAVVAACCLLVRAQRAPGRWNFILSGLPVAALVLVNHMVALLLLAGGLVALLAAGRARNPGRHSWGGCVLHCVPIVVVVLAVLLWATASGCVDKMFETTVVRPLGAYTEANALQSPFRLPSLSGLRGVLDGKVFEGIREARELAFAILSRGLPWVAVLVTAALLVASGRQDGRAQSCLTVLIMGLLVFLEAPLHWAPEINNTASLLLLVGLCSTVSLFAHPVVGIPVKACALATGLLALSFQAGRSIYLLGTWGTAPRYATTVGSLRFAEETGGHLRGRLVRTLAALPGSRTLFLYHYEPGIFAATGLEPVEYNRYFTPVLMDREELHRTCRIVLQAKPDVIVRDSNWTIWPSSSALTPNALDRCFLGEYVLLTHLRDDLSTYEYQVMVPKAAVCPQGHPVDR